MFDIEGRGYCDILGCVIQALFGKIILIFQVLPLVKEYWFAAFWNVIIGGVLGFLLGISSVVTVASAFSYEGGLMTGSSCFYYTWRYFTCLYVGFNDSIY